MDHNECMLALERLMEEFFTHSTTNERIREIENEFQALKTSPDAWHLCSHFIKHSSSQYLVMYALSILESVMNRLGKGEAHIREETRMTIQNYLFSSGIRAPHHLREKYAKLLVHIAKEDWPDSYPDFMPFIYELLQLTENRVLVGLIVLRTASEEFTNESSIPDTTRREELAKLFQPHIPIIFSLLINIFQSLDNKPRHSATATPPPSPTHSYGAMEPAGGNFIAPMDSFVPDSKAINREILKTLQHLFTWVPISTICSELIKCIFNIMTISSYSQEDMDLCMLALSTVNEILYRKCCPPGTEKVFVQLYHHTVDLIRDLSTSSMYQLESIDSMFVQKLSELTVLLIEQHLWKLEMHLNVPIINFLFIFFQLTIKLPSVQCYHQCLSTWEAVMMQIKHQKGTKYAEVLQGLLNMILNKFQYTTNFDQLKGINANEVNEDDETEHGLLIKASNEIIVLIGEVDPMNTFTPVMIQWINHCNNYSTVLSNQNVLFTASEEERDKVCCMFTDFSTLTKTLARLSVLYTDENNGLFVTAVETQIKDLYKKMLFAASVAHSTKMSNMNFNSKITETLDMVHSELLACLRAWIFLDINNEIMTEENLKLILDTTLHVLFMPQKSPECLGWSAACLLNLITEKIAKRQLFELKNVFDFVDNACLYRHPSVKIRQLIDESVCNLLLCFSHPRKPEDQEIKCDARSQLMSVYMSNLTKEFKTLTPSTEEEKVRRVSADTLESSAHIVKYSQKFNIPSKKLVYTCVGDTIEHCLQLFPVYVKYSKVNHNILTLFIAAIEVMPSYMGLEGMRLALNLFYRTAMQNADVACVEKVLQMMKSVVEVPSSISRALLPAILNLCLYTLYRTVLNRSKEYPELLLALLQLLHSILVHQWQYFHQSAVRAGFSPCVVDSERSMFAPQKPHELITILETFGQALLQEDINVSKFSIGALEDLNLKWNLYVKDIFKENLLLNFLNVLLSALMNKAYSLLNEDVQTAIYHMADRNFEIFFETFLPQFVSTLKGITAAEGQALLRNFERERDMPSFINQLKIFVGRAQTLCNS